MKRQQNRPTATNARHTDLLLGLTLALFAATLFATTAARDITWGDSAEFTLAAAELGIPHPTGYPIYMLAARLAAAGPGGSLPWRVNALSGLCAALAVGTCFALSRRLGLRRPAAAAAAVALMSAREVWLQATTAEVYTLHLLLVGLALWTACVWLGRRDPRYLAGTALIFGFGLSHHLTIVMLAPALAWMVWAGTRRLPPLTTLIWGLLPPTLYLVLILRSLAEPVIDQGDPESLGGLLTHLSGKQFSYRLFTSTPGYMLGELRRIGELFTAQWWPAAPSSAPGWLALLAGVRWLPAMLLSAGIALGLATLWRRRRIETVALLLLALALGFYVAGYNIPDKDGYLLPVILVMVLLLGAAADQLAGWVRIGPVRRLVEIGLILVPLVGMPLHRVTADRHADGSLRDLTMAAYGRTAPGSLILTDDTNTYFALLFLQSHEQLFTDRQPVLTYLVPLPWYLPALAPELPGLVTPALTTEVASRYAASATLRGATMGQRRAADQQELAARLARLALPERRVYLYQHKFEESPSNWQGLPLADRGLIYEVLASPATAAPDSVSIAFPRAAHYSTARTELHGERAVAKRYATAANREGIRRVGRGELAAAERAFRQAQHHDPEYAQSWLNLGLLYADYVNDPAAARLAWERYLELGGEQPEAGGVRRRLQQLPPAR